MAAKVVARFAHAPLPLRVGHADDGLEALDRGDERVRVHRCPYVRATLTTPLRRSIEVMSASVGSTRLPSPVCTMTL